MLPLFSKGIPIPKPLQRNQEVPAPAFPAQPRHLEDGLVCDVILGSPRDDCRGLGICKVVSDTFQLQAGFARDCRRTRATVRPDNEGYALELAFRRTDLCPLLFKTHFRKGIFPMPQPCLLPVQLVNVLGLLGGVLRPGMYPIQEKGNWLTVTISL